MLSMVAISVWLKAWQHVETRLKKRERILTMPGKCLVSKLLVLVPSSRGQDFRWGRGRGGGSEVANSAT